MRKFAPDSYFSVALWLAMQAGATACQSDEGDANDGTGADTGSTLDDESGESGDLPSGTIEKTRSNSLPGANDGAGGKDSAPPLSTAGGADAGAGSLPPLVTLAAACQMLAESECRRWFACAPALAGAADLDTCTERLRLVCVANGKAADTGFTTVAAVSCAHALQGAACADLINRREPAECRVIGRRAIGKSCGVGAQCESGHCGLAGNRCGACAARGGEGASCKGHGDTGCLPGLTCGPTATCVKPRALGAVCEVVAPCEKQLVCQAGKCVTPVPLGGACKDSTQCDRAQAQLCLPGAANKVVAGGPPPWLCQHAVRALAGEICGDATGVTHLCPGGFDACRLFGTSLRRCLVPVADGDVCSLPDDLVCEFPARCLANQCRLYGADGC